MTNYTPDPMFKHWECLSRTGIIHVCWCFQLTGSLPHLWSQNLLIQDRLIIKLTGRLFFGCYSSCQLWSCHSCCPFGCSVLLASNCWLQQRTFTSSASIDFLSFYGQSYILPDIPTERSFVAGYWSGKEKTSFTSLVSPNCLHVFYWHFVPITNGRCLYWNCSIFILFYLFIRFIPPHYRSTLLKWWALLWSILLYAIQRSRRPQ